MFYREAGQFKTSYKADQAIFPIFQDKVGLFLIVAVAFGLPLVGNDFFLNSLMIPLKSTPFPISTRVARKRPSTKPPTRRAALNQVGVCCLGISDILGMTRHQLANPGAVHLSGRKRPVQHSATEHRQARR